MTQAEQTEKPFVSDDVLMTLGRYESRNITRFCRYIGIPTIGSGVRAYYTAREFIALTLFGAVEEVRPRVRIELAQHILWAPIRGTILVKTPEVVETVTDPVEALPLLRGEAFLVDMLRLPQTEAGVPIVRNALSMVVC